MPPPIFTEFSLKEGVKKKKCYSSNTNVTFNKSLGLLICFPYLTFLINRLLSEAGPFLEDTVPMQAASVCKGFLCCELQTFKDCTC